MEQALRFKAMYTRMGFSVADAAKFLQVTPRTVHAWISGRVRIPYTAYKLLRVQLHYELPGDAWSGWSLSAGRLYTPEGHDDVLGPLRGVSFTGWAGCGDDGRACASVPAGGGAGQAAHRRWAVAAGDRP